MTTYKLGGLAISMAGHDKGKLFIIIGRKEDYVILADGKKRTIEHPKRKKEKHVQYVKDSCKSLMEAAEGIGRITNEMIKHELKQYQKGLGNGGSYVESRCSRN